MLSLLTVLSGAVGAPSAAAPATPAVRASVVTTVGEPQECPSYWVAADDGGVFTAGAAPFAGSGVGKLGAPVAALAGTPSGRGYWLASTSGRVAAFGDARLLGS